MRPIKSDYKDSNNITNENNPKKNEIKKQIKKILKSQLYGVLATSNDNQPYTSLLAFVASHDINTIYVATGRNTHKFQNVHKNEKIAFFIDTRSNDNFDVSTAYALTVFGRAKAANRNETAQIKKLYLSRHPQLDSFIHSQNVEFIQIKVSSFSFVERFQNVYLLEMNNENNNSIK